MEFYVLKSLMGTYFRDDNLGWTPDLDSATLFSSVQSLKDTCKFNLSPFRILKYSLVTLPNKTNQLYFQITLIESDWKV